MLGHSSRSSLKRSIRAGPGSQGPFHCPSQEWGSQGGHQGSPSPCTRTSLRMCWGWTCHVCWLHCCRGHSSAVGQRAEHQPLPGDSPGSKASRGAFSGCTIESTSPCESSMIPTSVVHETGRCHCPDPGDGIGVVGCNYLLSRHT